MGESNKKNLLPTDHELYVKSKHILFYGVLMSYR